MNFNKILFRTKSIQKCIHYIPQWTEIKRHLSRNKKNFYKYVDKHKANEKTSTFQCFLKLKLNSMCIYL